MTAITWDNAGNHLFEAGVDRGTLYVGNAPGVPWLGLVSVSENPTGGDVTGYYIDGVKYLNVAAASDFEATINAFYTPPEFDPCEGISTVDGVSFTEQARTPFCMTYRTRVGDELVGVDRGYKIHLIYNALAEPATKEYATLSDTLDPTALSWNVKTKPELLGGFRPIAHVILDSTVMLPEDLADLEYIIYGSDFAAPRMPYLTELIDFVYDGGPPLSPEFMPIADGGGP